MRHSRATWTVSNVVESTIVMLVLVAVVIILLWPDWPRLDKVASRRSCARFTTGYMLPAATKTPNQNDIVVALIDDEATLKRFNKSKGVIELHPANKNYKPIRVNESKSFEILGILPTPKSMICCSVAFADFPSSISLQIFSNIDPKKTEMIAGGASLAPKR